MRATPCRCSYGICVKLPFSDVKNKQRDRIDDNSVARANNQLLWLLNKGDLVRSDRALTGREEITVSFAKDAERKGKITIYKYWYDDARPDALRDNVDGGKLLIYISSTRAMQLTRNRSASGTCFGV